MRGGSTGMKDEHWYAETNKKVNQNMRDVIDNTSRSR
jgi:hypothetical protein